MSLLFAEYEPRRSVKHRQPGLPSILRRQDPESDPHWSTPVIVGCLLVSIVLLVWMIANPSRWISAEASETPHRRGVVPAAVAPTIHPWFGITMQCWDDQHRFVVWYSTDTPGTQGWERTGNIRAKLQVQEREGGTWYNLPAIMDSVGGLIVDERKLPRNQQWLRNARGSVLRLVTTDGYTSASQRIGYQNTCTGDA